LLADLSEQDVQTAEPLHQAILTLVDQLLGEPRATPPREPELWRQLAARQQLPLLPLLALAEECRPLHACLGGLRRSATL
jgi:hypothetical protein